MSLLAIALISAAILALAYLAYGSTLGRLLGLDRQVRTPAVELRDDVDYVPIEPRFLFGQHFSAIAAAGPIVGPILAGVMFGWGPALIWILAGSIFIGGIHDMGSLVASIRHKARSIAEVVREHMTRRSYILFMVFMWIALVYIIVAFTDIVAGSFVGKQTLENGLIVRGGGIASSSLLYLALPIAMGLLLRYTRIGLRAATAIFLPLVGVAIWVGQYIPFDIGALLGTSDDAARRIWDVILLAYCFVASLVPMWILLQPRGHLGGLFLLFAVFGGLLGIIFGGERVVYPAFTGWTGRAADGEIVPLFPLLFITIACGACSGFHALVASGTTSKQLRCETDAKPIGYGGMLMEALVAVISLGCVMMLPRETGVGLMGKPNLIYAQGIGSFLETIRIPATFGISFGLLAFTTFVYDTLDVSTRLGRYVLQELTGLRGAAGKYLATAATTIVPLLFVLTKTVNAAGQPIPAWRVFWPLFGASNQLLAALTLLAITVWLFRTTRGRWVWAVAGAPALTMYVMSMWALLRFVKAGFLTDAWAWKGIPIDPIPWAALALIGLAVVLLVEAARVLASVRVPRAASLAPRES